MTSRNIHFITGRLTLTGTADFHTVFRCTMQRRHKEKGSTAPSILDVSQADTACNDSGKGFTWTDGQR